MINTMVKNIVNEFYIREEDIPRCPRCGNFLVPNLRMDNFFVQESHFKIFNNFNDFNDFIEKAKGKNFVLLELDVGYNTPAIIKYPSNTTLIRINLGEDNIPLEIKNKGIYINDDIRKVLNLI